MGKFKNKIENFFYYYKWHTLIVLFFVVVVAVMIGQALEKPKYDIRVIYAGPVIVSEEKNVEISEAFGQLISEDFDGDKKKKAELFDLILMDSKELDAAYEKGIKSYFLNEDTVKQNRETLALNAMAGEYIIYVLDLRYYKELRENDIFIPLDDMGIDKGLRYDDCAVYLESLDFAKFYSSFDIFPFETVICVKKVAETKKGESKLERSQRYHINYFKTLTEFTLPEGYITEENQE